MSHLDKADTDLIERLKIISGNPEQVGSNWARTISEAASALLYQKEEIEVYRSANERQARQFAVFETQIARLKEERDEALDDAKFAERIAVKREADAEREKAAALAENAKLREALEDVLGRLETAWPSLVSTGTFARARSVLSELASASASPALGKDQGQSEATPSVVPPERVKP